MAGGAGCGAQISYVELFTTPKSVSVATT
jgi:hypothetical protein